MYIIPHEKTITNSAMIRFIRKGYLRLKCKECHTSHSLEGRDLVFDPYGKTEKDGQLEKKYLSKSDFFCKCDTKITAEIMIIEFPEGKISDVIYEAKNAEVTEKITINIL